MKYSGKFGPFGGIYVPELLVPVLEEIETGFYAFSKDRNYQKRLTSLLKDYAGRPTPLYHAEKLSQKCGFQVYLKREDLLHGGAHKTNNALGQGLLAQYLGKKHLIAETGAGQHGVATAMIGALLGLDVKIFMGEKDIERQFSNVQRMRLFGAEVISVTTGSKSLKDAINDAMRYWIAHSQDTYYLFGTAAGPHPFPTIVKEFQKVIGIEARKQILAQHGNLPHTVVACVGGGSNAIGIFSAFLDDTSVQLIGVEPGGEGVNTNKHGATLTKGSIGSLHGSVSKILQNKEGQINEAHSISAGLDYPGVGPEHAYLQSIDRATYISATDAEAIASYRELSQMEGIIPALESAHAIAGLQQLKGLNKRDAVIVNLSGRGDKDLLTYQHYEQ